MSIIAIFVNDSNRLLDFENRPSLVYNYTDNTEEYTGTASYRPDKGLLLMMDII